VYLRADSKIAAPADLKGKRVGVADYQMTAAVWARGFLSDDYGVKPEDIHWVIGRPVRTIKPPPTITCEFMRQDTTLEAMLERGEIDALISVMIPPTLGSSVRRLFAEPRQVERDYYQRTGIFPIMHTFVLKTALYEANPWLAISFYRAFCRAREIAYYWMYDTDALTVGLPWVIDELEATRKIFGPQVWDYSIEGSRPTLEALVRHLDEQKLTRRPMKVEELFVPNIGAGMSEYLRATAEA
jgi:4,5-dihydroxyphthalate decarboxylase